MRGYKQSYKIIIISLREPIFEGVMNNSGVDLLWWFANFLSGNINRELYKIVKALEGF